MSRRPRKNNGNRRSGFGALPPWADMRKVIVSTVSIAGIVAAALLLLYVVHATRQFLLTGEEFTLTPPPAFEFLSPNITVTGAANARESSIHAVFQDDFGRSIFLMNIDDRRLQLRNVEWVKDATVTRLWPNRIAVHVVERKPVAYIELPAGRADRDPSENGAPQGAPKRYMLIDADGYILRPKPGVGYKLPIVTGIRLSSDPADRRVRVGRMMALLTDLGEKSADIVEVDVSDVNSLRVRREMPHHSVTLILGNRHFRQRLETFERNYAELEKFLPPASVLDLRLEDRITEVHDRPADDAAAPPSRPGATATKPVAVRKSAEVRE